MCRVGPATCLPGTQPWGPCYSITRPLAVWPRITSHDPHELFNNEKHSDPCRLE